MSDDLAAFWEDRLDEDETVAKAAGGGNWETGCTCTDGCHGFPPCDEVLGDDIHIYPEGGHDSDQAAHIARYDPARALRDVAADRAALELWRHQDGYDLPDGVAEGRDPDERERDEALAAMLEHVARIRITRWNDHPDYREDWKP